MAGNHTAPNESGLCQCGCGLSAPVAKRTDTARGRIKGQPMRFIRGHNSVGTNRSKAWKQDRYHEEERGYETPCWIWQLRVGTAGYGLLTTGGKTYSAHRWYYEQARGAIPEGLQLDHLCCVKTCVNPDHLEPVTAVTNVRRGPSGKISDEQAREIYRRVSNGETQRALAAEFGVSHGTVGFIKRNGPDGPRNPHGRRR
jgi:hypothetical protein